MQLPKAPPPPPSSSADSDFEGEVEDEGYWERLAHLWSSPLVATACCIFLCYILKVVQQVWCHVQGSVGSNLLKGDKEHALRCRQRTPSVLRVLQEKNC